MPRKKLSQLTKSELFIKVYAGYMAENTLKEYARIINQIEKDSLTITSKSKYLQVKATLKKCELAGIGVKFNLLPWSKRGDSVKENIIDKSLEESDFLRVLDHLPKSKKGNELKLACRLAYYAGMRLSEVLGLKQQDINTNGHIELIFKGKGNKSRHTYLRKDQKEYIEGFQGFLIDKNYVVCTFRRIAKKLGFESTFHSLRHSFAHNFINAGGSLADLQKLLGHESLATTGIYLQGKSVHTDTLKAMGY